MYRTQVLPCPLHSTEPAHWSAHMPGHRRVRHCKQAPSDETITVQPTAANTTPNTLRISFDLWSHKDGELDGRGADPAACAPPLSIMDDASRQVRFPHDEVVRHEPEPPPMKVMMK